MLEAGDQGIFQNLFQSGQQGPEPDLQAIWDRNKTAVRTPASGMTPRQPVAAVASIEDFREFFGNAVEGYDLSEFTGPFIEPPEALDHNTGIIFGPEVEKRPQNDPDYEAWIFRFRRGEGWGRYYGDSDGHAEFWESTLSI